MRGRVNNISVPARKIFFHFTRMDHRKGLSAVVSRLTFYAVLLSFRSFRLCLATHNLELPVDQQQRLQNGEKEFAKIRSRVKHSKCWEDAVSRLQDGCKDLTDIEQSRLAIAFANCHLSKSGLKTYSCRNEQSIEECTKEMTGSVLAFNTYTEFYTHTSDICFYLQSKIWQQKTEDTVNRLTSSSLEVADRLEVSLANQQKVLKGQMDSLINQEQMIKNEAYLKNALKSSAENAKEAFMDMKRATAKQKAVLMETFDGLFKGVDRITKLQSMLLGEFMTLHSLGFYLVSILACYIITSAQRTAAARLWLFGVLSVHILIERLLVRWSVTDKDSQENGTTTEILHDRLWTFRKIFVVESLVTLIYFASKYCDYAKINYKMLRDIQRELQKLKGSGSNIGKCLTDGPNNSLVLEQSKSFTDYSLRGYSVVYPLESLNDDLSEEEIFTDDSASCSEEEGRESASESDDPTFIMDVSQTQDLENQNAATNCTFSGPVCNTYNLRPRQSTVCFKEASSCRLPSPNTFSDLIFNLSRSTAVFGKQGRKTSRETFSCDEDD